MTVLDSKKKRWLLICLVLIITFVLSYISLHLKLEVTPAWNNGILEHNHELLMNFEYTNNEQSRLLQFYIPEFFIRTFEISVIKAYMLQRLIFVWAMLFAFYLFLEKWFTIWGASICVIFVWILQNSTFANDLQESSALLALTFLGGIWAIRDNKPIAFMIILTIGGINNETILFLPATYFFYNFSTKDILSNWKIAVKTIALSIPAFTAVGIIRYINRNQPHLGGAWHWEENIDNINKLYDFLHFYWFLPLLAIFLLPKFLQRSYLSLPLFILPHLITGIIEETRQMVPLTFIIVPSCLITIILISDRIRSIYRSKFQKSENIQPI